MLRKVRLEQYSELIGQWHKSGARDLVIVLGTGSFGHPIAKKHHLEKGLKKSDKVFDRWRGAIETRLSVMDLLMKVSEILFKIGVPVFPVSPAGIYCEGELDISIVRKALLNGLVPVLHGDMVFDGGDGALIYSGDNVTVDVAKALSADEIHFVTKGDGVFFGGEKIERISALDLADALVNGSKQKMDEKFADVSAGFFGKLGACLDYVPKRGIRIYDGEMAENFKRGFLDDRGGSLITATFN